MMRTRAYWSRCLALLSLMLFLATPVFAQNKGALLLYKSSEEANPQAGRIANNNIIPILKSLGFTPRFHDVDKGLPRNNSAELIVSWYSSAKIADPEAYVDWLASELDQGKKVVILGNFGAHTADGSTWMTDESLNRFFYPFGLKYGAAYSGDANVLRVTREVAPARRPDRVFHYLLFRSVNPDNKVLLEVERSDLPNSKSALVVRTPYGAMAQESYAVKTDLQKLFTDVVKSEQRSTAQGKKLLGLYKASEGVDARTNWLARFVAPTLFDLGYGIDYYNIEQGIPTASKMSQYAGVISWYNTPVLPKAGDYVDWLTDQMEAGKRVVILGNFGAFAEDIPSSAGPVRRFLQSPEYNKFFFPFGLEFRGAWTPEKSSVTVVKKDPSVMAWLEPNHVGHYYWIRSVHPDNEQFLSVNRADLRDGESAVVVATPRGGMALESYVMSTDPATKLPRMHIELRKFLDRSLNLQATSEAPLRPKTSELVSKPALPEFPVTQVGGDGRYPVGTQPILRKVMAFYQSSANESATNNQTFLAAQMVLEHLGMLVEYHDLDNPRLPSMQEMQDYRGIIVWLADESVPQARAFDKWLQDNVKAGRKLVLMGDYEIREKNSSSLVNPQATYASVGVFYDPLGNAPLMNNARGQQGFRRIAPNNVKVLRKLPGVMDFERKLNFRDKDLRANWHLISSMWKDSEVGLTVQQQAGTSDVVVITKNGGVAVGPFPLFNEQKDRRKQRAESVGDSGKAAKAEDEGGKPWRMDPFRFFAKAFQVEGLPKPDITTRNGSRIYYSHIDGDAFGGISHIDRSSINGEMMYHRILKQLPLPVTVSYVTKDIESRLNERYSRELTVAQDIFKLPNIEPASHTYAHPFDWQLGDLALSAGGGYKLSRKPIDLNKEISHSLDFIDRLSPPNKRCEILLWSGRCNPKPEAIELVRKRGLINMNGAESTYDTKFPYVAGLLPLFGDKGRETQFHVSAAGDFYYTGSWTQNYDGMKQLVDYFNRTETPRRLRCMNVYYHFYLAEKELGIQGLQIAYNDVLRRSPAPMFASDYAKLLKDSMETKMALEADGRFWISNTGLNATVRFDQESRYPDLERSEGVIGYNRANGSLYVHLDGTGDAIIGLTDRPPSRTYLKRFTQDVEDWQASPESVSFVAEGQGPAHLEIGNLIPSSVYRIDTGAGETSVRADAQGTLVWRGRFDGYKQSHRVSVRKVAQ